MDNLNKTKCILAIKADAEFSTYADDVVVWHDGNPTNITDEQILAKWNEMNALWEVQRIRGRSYPTITEQLDYIYHNGIDKWKTDIVDPVKAKYPKPE